MKNKTRIGLSDETLKEYGKPWKCKQCGDCCRFIVIPVGAPVHRETKSYLEAHGIALLPPPHPSPSGGGSKGEGTEYTKLIIPAVCKYLTKDNKCRIHGCKFSNCRLAGERECKECKLCWDLLNSE